MLDSQKARGAEDYGQSHRLEKRLAAINRSYSAFVTNKAFTDYFGCSHFETLLDYLHPEDAERFKAFVDSYAGKDVCSIFRFRNNEGEFRYNILKLLDDHNNCKDYIYIEMIDVEGAVDVNHQLVDDISKIRLLLGMTDEYTFCYNRLDNIFCLYHYEQLQRSVMYRMDIDDWKKFVLEHHYVAAEDEDKFIMLISEIKSYTEGISININTSLRTQSDMNENLRFNGLVYHNSNQEKIVIGRILLSEEVSQQQSIQFIDELHYDSLTNVYNKKSITDYAVKAIESVKSNRVVLVVLDVDHFKAVNDTYGHLYGDKVLSRVGNKLKSIVGDDGLVGRIGGDEFMIVLNGINDDQLLRSMLRAIRTQIKWEFSEDFEDFMVTCSIGASICPLNGTSFEDLFNKADYCLYIAKEKGRDRYVFFREELHSKGYEESFSKKLHGQQSNGREIKELQFIREFMQMSVKDAMKAFQLAREHMFMNYKIDSINIYYGPEMKKVYSYGQPLVNADNAAYVFTDEFKTLLDGKTYIGIGFPARYKVIAPNFCQTMKERNELSSIQCLLGTPDHILGLITYDRCKESSQWADYEVDGAVIVASMLSRHVMKKEDFHNM